MCAAETSATEHRKSKALKKRVPKAGKGVVPMPAKIRKRKPVVEDGGGQREGMELTGLEDLRASSEIREALEPAVGLQEEGPEVARKRKKKKRGVNDAVDAAASPALVLASQAADVRDPGAATDDDSGATKDGQPKSGALRGMKKWLAAYHAERPGADVLQQQIDEFILDCDARQAKARADREAAAAADGWTLVLNKGGRKKTTDADGGITVGAVSSAAAVGKVAKRQKKAETAADFYRFQKREQHRNKIMELQQKFDNDKKRLARLKAARKFTPY